MTRITGSHHVLSVKHLLGKLSNSDSSVLLGSTASERSESRHEEVETREGDHVDSKLTEICIKLTGESETCGHSTHRHGNKVVEVMVVWACEFQGTEADVVKCLVVDAESLIRILYKLVN